jgi:hypothetical protein
MDENVKELFEKVKEKGAAAVEFANKKANDAGRKAGELWEITRLRMQIYDLNSELKDIFRKMGEIVFAAHQDPDADTGGIDALLTQAAEKSSEINGMRQRVASFKQADACANPDCGRSVEKEDAFCRTCGTAVPREEA